MPIEKPDMFVLSPDNVELGWHSAKVPDLIRETCNLTYTIEVRFQTICRIRWVKVYVFYLSRD